MALEFLPDAAIRQSVPPSGPKILPGLDEFRALLQFVMDNHGQVYDGPKQGSDSARSMRPASVAKEFTLPSGIHIAIRRRIVARYEQMTRAQRAEFSNIVRDDSEQWEIWLTNRAPIRKGARSPVQLLALSLGVDQVREVGKSDIHLSMVAHRGDGTITKGRVSAGEGRLEQDLTSRSALRAMRLVRRYILQCLPTQVEPAALVG